MKQLGVVALAALLSGCINTDEAIFVDASLRDANGTIETSSLSTGFSGSFAIDLHLGLRASGPSEVQLGGFSVQNADRTTTIVQVLKTTSQPTFPVLVSPSDDDVTIQVAFGSEDNLLDNTSQEDLCAPEGVVIVAALQGSLRGSTISPVSAPFPVSGCP